MNVYQSAHQNAVWRDMSHFGRFAFSGADSATLLHHLTTNDIKKLQVGQGCETVLINSKARVLDLLSVWRRADNFLVLTSPNRRANFAPHAQKFILYRQDVKIEDITDDSALLGIFGPQTHRVLESLEINDFDFQTSAVQHFVIDNVQITVVRTSRLPLDGVLMWSDNRESLLHLLQQNDAPQCDNETYNLLRIEAGLPIAGLELTEEINPWEGALDNAISLHKGCYNGQEIVARLNTYQKVKRSLRGVKLQRLVKDLPAKLTLEGRDAGTLTSCVASPQMGNIGLALVRGDYAQAGQVLQIEDTSATVCDLPFIAN